MQTARRTPISGNRRRLFFVIAFSILVVDQLSKVWAVSRLEGTDPIVIIDGFFSLNFVRNPGAAFSFAEGFTFVIALIALAVCGYLIRLSGQVSNILWTIALSLVFAGAMGNLLDRILREPGVMRGHVVDFLQFTFINFPIFNVADIAITFGAIFIVLLSWRGIDINGEVNE